MLATSIQKAGIMNFSNSPNSLSEESDTREGANAGDKSLIAVALSLHVSD